MLRNHDTYEQNWSRQVQSAAKVRDTLTGRVNLTQKYNDQTLAEKVDGEIATNIQVRNVLAKGFELTNNSYARDAWLSGLRSPTSLASRADNPRLGPNMRTHIGMEGRITSARVLKDTGIQNKLYHAAEFSKQRFVYSSQTNKVPPAGLIPATTIESKPIQEEIFVKPLLTYNNRLCQKRLINLNQTNLLQVPNDRSSTNLAGSMTQEFKAKTPKARGRNIKLGPKSYSLN